MPRQIADSMAFGFRVSSEPATHRPQPAPPARARSRAQLQPSAMAEAIRRGGHGAVFQGRTAWHLRAHASTLANGWGDRNNGLGTFAAVPHLGLTPPSRRPLFRHMRNLQKDGLWIGTSGWTYDSWRGPFYPAKMAANNWLSWYGTQFPTTEINASFYRTPSLGAVRAWCEQTPPHFLFAWKASKFITHWKRLNSSCKTSLALMTTRLNVLGRKCGPVLFQLPAGFKADHERLADFLRMLPARYQYAFEFRHESWYDDNILDLLRHHDVALCLSDHHQAPAPWIPTARLVYVRGHGPDGRYEGNYSDATLRQWAASIRRWRAEHREVFVFFDNDQKSAAPRDARRLLGLMDARRGGLKPSRSRHPLRRSMRSRQQQRT
jgi:uncharacterized protein YecE (DUF72 family)